MGSKEALKGMGSFGQGGNAKTVCWQSACPLASYSSMRRRSLSRGATKV